MASHSYKEFIKGTSVDKNVLDSNIQSGLLAGRLKYFKKLGKIRSGSKYHVSSSELQYFVFGNAI